MAKKGPNSKPGLGGKAFQNWMYYRNNRTKLVAYYREHHWQWRGMKKFAKATGMSLKDARTYIDQKLKGWYVATGYLPQLDRLARPRRRSSTRVWRNQ